MLDTILQNKRGELAAAQRAVSRARLEELAGAQPASRPFRAALQAGPDESAPRLIAEIKKSSPARGPLALGLDVRATARTYQDAGASAISVLTDARFFGGSLDDLRAVRAEVSVPILRKDFLFSPYQLWEARAAGADAALLIVAALASPLVDLTDLRDVEDLVAPIDPGAPDLQRAAERLADLLEAARSAGLECLVEVHDAAELDVAVRSGAGVIGINNRDLRTLETRLEVTERLAGGMAHAPGRSAERGREAAVLVSASGGGDAPARSQAVLVSESGIESADDVRRVRRAGASAILVGSAIVAAPDVGAKIRELLSA
ncbi:MAG: indole-3-glycerol phosphate synthase TrpC [Chloroflexota bacterium]|nr:indole-3-glycerol phosphate synthase TrpC [Chloroflexota bacterium]